VNAQRSAELQVVLEGIPLPARRATLIEYAARQDSAAAAELELLPEGEYDRLDAVGEALLQPPRAPEPGRKPPRPESGKPPGGPDYLRADPQSGAVRPSAPRTHPPQKPMQEQSQLQQQQKANQEG
jgi:hypothetical protein